MINGPTLSGLMDEDEQSPHRKGQHIPEKLELYNLAVDPFEKKNLAAENPGKLAELRSGTTAGRTRPCHPGVPGKPPAFTRPGSGENRIEAMSPQQGIHQAEWR